MAESIFDLSICILTRNQPLLLPQCVTSCLAEIERAKVTAEIIVVDNASADRYPEKLLTLSPSIRVLRNEQNAGFSAGNNQAIRASRGRYVLILNDDAILQEGCLGLLLQALESHSGVGVVGPKLLNPDGSIQRGYTNRRLPRLRFILCELLHLERALEGNKWTRSLFIQNRNSEESGQTEYVAGACLLAPREVLNAVNLFDEEFYYLYEDVDLCYRLQKAGWCALYLAEARVIHFGSASFRKLDETDRRAMQLVSLLRFLRKSYGITNCLIARLILVLVFLVRIPALVVYKVCRSGLRDKEWAKSVRQSVKAAEVLLSVRR